VTAVVPLRSGAVGGRIEVRVDGLACRSICVRRTEGALRSLPGVTAVRFEPGPDRFEVESDGPPPDASAVARAVHSVVVAPWARRLIAALAERLQRPFTRSRC
jgi:hypothetical protein